MKYFIADTHFGQKDIYKFPNRSNYNEQSWSEMILDKINSKYCPEDILYILGDFAFSKQSMIKYRQKIKFRKIFLIHGNHDPSKSFCHTVFGAENVFQTKEIKIKTNSCFLSHYPHLAWPESHYGSLHLYGHIHDQRSLFWENIFPEIRALDVSPESYKRHFGDFGVWSEDEICDLLLERSGHDDVSWYRVNLNTK